MNHADDELLAAAVRRRAGAALPADVVDAARHAVVHRAGRVRRRRAIAAGSLASLAIVVGTAALVSGADRDQVVRTPADRPDIGVVATTVPRPSSPRTTTVATIEPTPSTTPTTPPTPAPTAVPATSSPATPASTAPPAVAPPGSPLTTIDDHGGDDDGADSGSNSGSGSSGSGSSGSGSDDDSSGSGRDGSGSDD